MAKKVEIKYSHWELLLLIYQEYMMGAKVFKHQCNKTLIKTCFKNGWAEEYEDNGSTLVKVTEKGMKDAEEIAPLYEKIHNTGFPY